jgi:hypothetical protein
VRVAEELALEIGKCSLWLGQSMKEDQDGKMSMAWGCSKKYSREKTTEALCPCLLHKNNMPAIVPFNESIDFR